MARGRNPKPAHLRVIDGGAGHRPDPGKAEPHALAAEAPHCPAPVKQHRDAHAMWKRMVPELVRAGLITKVFEGPLAGYCMAYGRWIQAERALRKLKGPAGALLIRSPKGYLMQSPYLAIANRALEQVRAFAADLGLSPTAIARATRSTQGELFGDEFDDFMNRGTGA